MRKIFKVLWPVIFIVALWLVWASPYFLQKGVPFPSTYLNTNFGPWSEYKMYLGPVKNGATPDVISQIFPWKKLVINSWQKGEVPLWNPYAFSGTPLLANYQSAALSPINILYFVFPFVDAWSIQVLLQPLLAGLFMYMFISSLKVSRPASIVSSVAFMFCGFITSWGLYGTLGYAILFLPLALWAIEKYDKTSKWLYPAILAISIPLSFFSGHFQTSLYFLIVVVSFSTFKFITQKDSKLFIINVLSIACGLLMSAPQLLPTIELYSESVRSVLFMKTEVIPWTYLPTFLLPDFFGNPVTRNDWFGHYAEWNAYIGLVPLILALYSVRKRTPYVLYFAGVALVTILIAFQTPLLDLLIMLRIPALSTSAASRSIVIFSFAAAVLAAFGFDRLMEDIKNKKVEIIATLCIGVSLVFGLLFSIIFLKLFMPPDKLSVAFSNMKLPTVIFVAFVMSVLTGALLKNKKVQFILPVLLIAIISFDLIRFSAKWQPYDPKNLVYQNIPIGEFASSTSGYDRAFGNFGQELSTMLHIPGLEGYDPLYIARYGEFINAAPDGNYHAADRSVTFLSKNGKNTGKILDFLGTKYILHKIGDARAVWAFPYWEYPVDQFRSIYKDDRYEVLQNDKVLPRAFIVPDYKVLNDKKKILKEIFHKDLNLKNSVIFEDVPTEKIDGGATGSAEIKKYAANKIEIQTKTNGASVLVLSDPFYPGWKAFVDGQEKNIYRVNYAFRGVVVPEGQHDVEFTYSPESFRNGLILFLLGMGGTIIIGFYNLLKRK